MSDYHYYASTAYGWATGATEKQALAGCARYVGTSILAKARKQNGGVQAVVARVELPEAAHYNISGYVPTIILKEDGVNEARKGEPVPVSGRRRVLITNLQGRAIPDPDTD